MKYTVNTLHYTMYAVIMIAYEMAYLWSTQTIEAILDCKRSALGEINTIRIWACLIEAYWTF